MRGELTRLDIVRIVLEAPDASIHQTCNACSEELLAVQFTIIEGMR